MIKSWMVGQRSGSSRGTSRSRRRLAMSGPSFETLESRQLLATIVINPDAYSLPSSSTLQIQDPTLGILASATVNGNPFTPGSLHAVLETGTSHGRLALNDDGTFTYTPRLDYAGTTDLFTYDATTDGTDLTGSPQTVRLFINPADQGPTAAAVSYTVGENVPSSPNVTLSVTAPGVLLNSSSPVGSPLSARLVTYPAHGALSLGADGTFNYTPNPTFSGSDTFSFQAVDQNGQASPTAVATILVTPDVPATVTSPYPLASPLNVLENTPITVALPGVLANVVNTTGNTQSAIVLSGPTNGALSLDGSGNFSYVPNTNFFGTDHFTFAVTDGVVTSAPATANIVVQETFIPATAVADSYSVQQNATLNVAVSGVLLNDSNPNGNTSLAVTAVNGPLFGALTLNSTNGSFTYAPNPNFSGTDSFTYKLADSTNSIASPTSSTATVTINVIPVPPVVMASTFTMQEDDLLLVAQPGVLLGASDPNNLPLTAVLVSSTQNGTLVLDPGGGFSYMPHFAFVGVDSFTFEASNGALKSNLGTVTINVTAIAPTTVRLDPASDTGVSNTDRITKDNTPIFLGTALPAVTVILSAQVVPTPGGPIPAWVPVGTATSDPSGNFAVQSQLLADGSYSFRVEAVRADGTSTGSVGAGNLEIDTVSPRVTGAVMIPTTGQIYVTYQDDRSGMAQSTVVNTGNYSLTRPTFMPRFYQITAAKFVPPASTTGPVTVALKSAMGSRIPHGRYLFAILSGGVTDVAGNLLDGHFNGQFPSGNGAPGSQFDAIFPNQGYAPVTARPTAKFVAILTRDPALHRPALKIVIRTSAVKVTHVRTHTAKAKPGLTASTKAHVKVKSAAGLGHK
jgi:hypothetical protein